MNNNCSNVISVTATASEKCAANTVQLSVTVRGEADKYAAALADANARADVAVNALNAVGVKLASGGISVNTATDENRKSVYRAVLTFRASFHFDGAILEKAIEALSAVDVVWNISFAFDDEKKRRSLIKKAVERAKADASAIAEAAGVKLGGLCCVDYADGGRPMVMRASLGGAEPEEITVSQTVTCSWHTAA